MNHLWLMYSILANIVLAGYLVGYRRIIENQLRTIKDMKAAYASMLDEVESARNDYRNRNIA